MKRSEIMTFVENAMATSGIDIATVTRLDTINVDDAGYELSPSKSLPSGNYGLVELRIVFPLN